MWINTYINLQNSNEHLMCKFGDISVWNEWISTNSFMASNIH